MEHGRLQARILDPADRYLKGLPSADQVKIAAAITLLLGNEAAAVRIKQLKDAVRELISGRHRVTYFKFGDALYFVRGFRKKTQKTPRKEIEYAESTYKQILGKK